MLCPEVVNFPPPKVLTFSKDYEDLETIHDLERNSFYKSIIVTFPDEIKIPSVVQDKILEDSDYYKVFQCPVTEFLEKSFVENFAKNGHLYCLSSDRNCIKDNCFAITPDGILSLHVLEYVFQTLGIEGTKCKHGFYEVSIDLKNLLHVEKIKTSVAKLGLFDFHMVWHPGNEEVCPSSIAKYFHDRGLNVENFSLEIEKINPTISEVPALHDVDIDEMVEWIGMLAHNVSMEPIETYISTYRQPGSENALQTNRMSIAIVRGIFTPDLLREICKQIMEYVNSRELDNYWASLSVQHIENSPWKWSIGCQRLFQSHTCSHNIFFTQSGLKLYSIGEIKYS